MRLPDHYWCQFETGAIEGWTRVRLVAVPSALAFNCCCQQLDIAKWRENEFEEIFKMRVSFDTDLLASVEEARCGKPSSYS